MQMTHAYDQRAGRMAAEDDMRTGHVLTKAETRDQTAEWVEGYGEALGEAGCGWSGGDD